MAEGTPLGSTGTFLHNEIGCRRPPDGRMKIVPPAMTYPITRKVANCSLRGVLSGERHRNLEGFVVILAKVGLSRHFYLEFSRISRSSSFRRCKFRSVCRFSHPTRCGLHNGHEWRLTWYRFRTVPSKELRPMSRLPGPAAASRADRPSSPTYYTDSIAESKVSHF